MKTGGTLNFLKKAGAIFMLLAIFASSCNKYADDFKQLNTKLDALASTVAGVTTLQSSITSLATQVTALQAAVAALPKTADISALSASLASITTKIDGLTATLKAVADAGTATKAVVDGLKTDLKALADKVKADNDAMKLQLTDLGTSNKDQTTLLNSLITKNDGLLAAIAASQTALIADNDVTQASIAALQLVVDAQKQILDQLLANSSIYNGDVTITTVSEMRTYFKRISQLAVVNGNVYINTSGSTLVGKLDSVNMITSKITAVVGANLYPNSVKLVTTSTSPKLDFSGLVSVTGSYTITGLNNGPGVDVLDNNLTTVGRGVELNYDGAYDFPNLTSIGSMSSSGLNPWVWSGDGTLTLNNVPKSSTNGWAGTTSINMPNVTVSGYVYDGNHIAGVLVYPEATSIALSGGVSSLTVDKAISVSLGSVNFDLGLNIAAPKCTTLSLSKATSAALPVSISTAADCTVDFSSLKSADGGLTIEGPSTLDMFGKLASGSLSSTTATKVVLAVHEWRIPANIPNVTSLTLGALANSLNTGAFAALKSLDVKGKAFSTSSGKFGSTYAYLTSNVTTTASNTALVSVNLQGNLRTAWIQNNSSLASLTTAGVINDLSVDGAGTDLTAVTLNHTHYVGGPGSSLVVINNSKLASLSSGVLDYPRQVLVASNGSLATLDLSSYKTPLLAAAGALTSITILGNKLSGDYVNATAITATTPYKETKITSAALNTLKTFVGLYPVPTTDIPNPVPALRLSCDLDKVTLSGGSSTATLSSRMTNDFGHTRTNGAAFNFTNPSFGLAAAVEFSLLQ